jgi:hypothetical protein
MHLCKLHLDRTSKSATEQSMCSKSNSVIAYNGIGLPEYVSKDIR